MPWVRGFIWDEENMEHVAQHQVSPEEVEEALTGDPLVLRGAEGRYLAYGKTTSGRHLFVVYVPRGRGRVRVLTAREMTEKETRLYRTKPKGKR